MSSFFCRTIDAGAADASLSNYVRGRCGQRQETRMSRIAHIGSPAMGAIAMAFVSGANPGFTR
jgi:hypothetical protein